MKSIRAEATAWDDMSPQAVEDRRELPFFEWCMAYLPHYFTAAPWARHIDAERASHEQGMPQFHCWSRGAGKSTIFSLAKPLRWILDLANPSDRSDRSDRPDPNESQERGAETGVTPTVALRSSAPATEPLAPVLSGRHFIIFGGATEDVAIDRADFVALELAENPRILADYGHRACSVNGEEGARVMGDTLLWCRGIGQSARGQRHRQYRPDAFVGDDLENDVLVRNPKREAELWDWLMGATFPGMESHGARASFLVVGTMYGRGCMMARAREQSNVLDPAGRPLCRYYCYPLRDERGVSTWPERYSDEDLARACSVMGTRIARREIDCKEDDESAAFRADWIQDFNVRDVPPEDLREWRLSCHVDPSSTHSETSDFKALVLLGQPPKASTKPPEGSQPSGGWQPGVYCLHAWIRRATPGEMVAEMARVHRQFGCMISCEDNALKAFLWEAIMRYEERDGLRVPVRSATATTNKADRILANQPEFEAGRCWFDVREGDQQLLVDQFLDFGKTAVHDDGPDAWDGARSQLPGAAGAVPFSYQGMRRGGDARSMFGLGRGDPDQRPNPMEDRVHALR